MNDAPVFRTLRRTETTILLVEAYTPPVDCSNTRVTAYYVGQSNHAVPK